MHRGGQRRPGWVDVNVHYQNNFKIQRYSFHVSTVAFSELSYKDFYTKLFELIKDDNVSKTVYQYHSYLPNMSYVWKPHPADMLQHSLINWPYTGLISNWPDQ